MPGLASLQSLHQQSRLPGLVGPGSCPLAGALLNLSRRIFLNGQAARERFPAGKQPATDTLICYSLRVPSHFTIAGSR